MVVVSILLAVVAACVIIYGIRNVIVADELDERRDELDRYSTYLEERASKLASEEKDLRELRKELYLTRDGQRIIQESGEDVR